MKWFVDTVVTISLQTPGRIAYIERLPTLPPQCPAEMFMYLLCRSVSIATIAMFVTGTAVCLADEPTVDFSRDVRRILSDKCFKCHGPDATARQAGLRLDTREGATTELESGQRAIAPGKSAESALVQRITTDDVDERMPPADSGKTLTTAEITILKRWIDQGAEWRLHWSLVKPTQPKLPTVKNGALIRNAIDHIVQVRLEREGWSLSQPADKAALLRRVTLDLTGLPATPAEVDAFLADGSAEAYGRVVDRLLASPHYGEHMARYWLDSARYGDTHGLHFDNERSIWKYRDWVIQSLNANMPFNQFTVEQIAGDLLPDATVQQRVATGFNRCNVTTNEGGSIDAEVLVRYAVDRTETMSTVFLGLTLGCAVCHDHKFDPVSQKEFYQLFAFYNSAADSAMDGNISTPGPIVRVPDEKQVTELQSMDEQIAAVDARIAERLAEIRYVDPNATATGVRLAVDHVWIDDGAPPGDKLFGPTAWELVGKPEHSVYSGKTSIRVTSDEFSQAYALGATQTLRVGDGDKLFAYCYLDPANPPKAVMLQFNDGDWEHRWYWGEDVIPIGAPAKRTQTSGGRLPKAGEWIRLEVDASAVGIKPGATIGGWAFSQFGGTVYWDHAGINSRTPQVSEFASLADWDAYQRWLPKPNVPEPIEQAIKTPPETRDEHTKQTIRNHFLEHVCTSTRPDFESKHKERGELQQRRDALEKRVPVSLAMADLPTPRPTHVLVRGEYDKPGEKVEPDVPSVFPRLPDGVSRNRLGLARWLVDPANPLTARVAVNRYWQQYFGRGIVKTTEDFGAQGEWPTHPELLDWLAVEFIDSGWNIKHIQRLIVMSATYQQASRVTGDSQQRDPENALLSRGPRFRLDAETIRDSALFVSGLLADKVGGRSVRPYQPAAIWESVSFQSSDTHTYKRDSGAALYRRSLYTFWKRTAPPPSLMAFDAPSRETCVARRSRTNTPLQALVLMNDEQYVEAARQLAQRMVIEGGEAPSNRLTYGFRLVTSRLPLATELDILLQTLEQHRAHFQADRDAATKLLSVGEAPRENSLDVVEHSAYTMLASLLLNLDEAITKE